MNPNTMRMLACELLLGGDTTIANLVNEWRRRFSHPDNTAHQPPSIEELRKAAHAALRLFGAKLRPETVKEREIAAMYNTCSGALRPTSEHDVREALAILWRMPWATDDKEDKPQ